MPIISSYWYMHSSKFSSLPVSLLSMVLMLPWSSASLFCIPLYAHLYRSLICTCCSYTWLTHPCSFLLLIVQSSEWPSWSWLPSQVHWQLIKSNYATIIMQPTALSKPDVNAAQWGITNTEMTVFRSTVVRKQNTLLHGLASIFWEVHGGTRYSNLRNNLTYYCPSR